MFGRLTGLSVDGSKYTTAKTVAYDHAAHGIGLDETVIKDGLAAARTRHGQFWDCLVGLERVAQGECSAVLPATVFLGGAIFGLLGLLLR